MGERNVRVGSKWTAIIQHATFGKSVGFVAGTIPQEYAVEKLMVASGNSIGILQRAAEGAIGKHTDWTPVRNALSVTDQDFILGLS